MRLTEIIKSAAISIWSMKVRSFLTSLGVIIGVFAIASLLSIGQASTRQMRASMANLNISVIQSSIFDEHNEIKMNDLIELSENDNISAVAPEMRTNGEVINGLKKMNVNIIGTNDNYTQIRGITLKSGRFILPIDIENKSKVAVLGNTVALKLFGNTDITGEKFSYGDTVYTIIGVADSKPSTWMGNLNEQIYMPISCNSTLFNAEDITTFVTLASSDEKIDNALNDINSLLISKTDGKTDGYYSYSANDTQQVINEMNSTLMALLGGIGVIALLISGIGIMNIMLVSVRERTREIGIRKAIGARRSDILIQFLIEAVIISLFGGIVGILLTSVLADPIGQFMSSEILLDFNVALISISFAFVSGVIFGFYPAAKASKLIPIEALRYE